MTPYLVVLSIVGLLALLVGMAGPIGASFFVLGTVGIVSLVNGSD